MEYHKPDLNLEQNWTVKDLMEKLRELPFYLNLENCMFLIDILEPVLYLSCAPGGQHRHSFHSIST